PQKLHSKLDVPRLACRGDSPKRRRAQEIVGQVEVWMIEEIEGLSAKLNARPLRQRRVLHQRRIDRLITRTVDDVSPGIAKRSRRRKRKSTRVEPIVDVARS